MSAQTMADAFAPAEERHRQQIMKETWGHLAPKRNRIYKGKVIWALGCFGSDNLNPTPLFCDFSGLDSSPWFYDALIDFLSEHSSVEGKVFRFDGIFQNYEFTGTIRQLKLK